MQTQRNSQPTHLTDEQFTELLLGTNPPVVREHLEACQQCAQEAELVSGAIGDFQRQSYLWAERRASASEPLRSSHARQPAFPWLHRPRAWTVAALAIALVAGIGVSLHFDHARAMPQPVAQVQPAVAFTPTRLKADNELLSAIDGELRADDSATNDMYGLNVTSHQAPTETSTRISN